MAGYLEGGVAVVTGAAQALGRALAAHLAQRNCALALVDVDEAGLRETAAKISGMGAAVSTHIVDVADESRMRAFAAEVLDRHCRVTILINNAGVALHGYFQEISVADMQWLMGINFWGAVYGVSAFLPALRREPRAHIVNLSSVFGIIAPAGETAYSASKFAVRGFTEALRHELEGTTVRVSCVHPGGIRTGIARRARRGAHTKPAECDAAVALFERLARTPPEAAAARIVRGIEHSEPRILIGSDAYHMDRIQRFFPVRYWRFFRHILNPPSSEK